MIATGAGSSTTVIVTMGMAYCFVGAIRPICPNAVRTLVGRMARGGGTGAAGLFGHPLFRMLLPVIVLGLLLWADWTLYQHPPPTTSAAPPNYAQPPTPMSIYGANGRIYFRRLFQQCAPDIKLNAMAALVKVESHGNPYVINVNYPGHGLARQPTNEAEAIATAERLLRQGYSIDMGLTQINSSNLSWVGLTVETVFDPCNNVRAAATILHAGIQRASKITQNREQALLAAYSLYNTGSMIKGYHNGYVRKIMVAARSPFPPD